MTSLFLYYDFALFWTGFLCLDFLLLKFFRLPFLFQRVNLRTFLQRLLDLSFVRLKSIKQCVEFWLQILLWKILLRCFLSQEVALGCDFRVYFLLIGELLFSPLSRLQHRRPLRYYFFIEVSLVIWALWSLDRHFNRRQVNRLDLFLLLLIPTSFCVLALGYLQLFERSSAFQLRKLSCVCMRERVLICHSRSILSLMSFFPPTLKLLVSSLIEVIKLSIFINSSSVM